MQDIEADSEETWPEVMLRALSNSADDLAAYQAKRVEIDRAAEHDVALRIDRPANPFQKTWDDVLEISKNAVARRRLLGFHATRLTDPERSDIGLNGLRVLTPKLLEDRLQAARREGVLSEGHLASLRARNQADDSNRRDRIALCFSRGLLKDEGGIGRLFRSWGGETLYNSHESDAVTGPALMAIGQPGIIVAAAPIDEIRCYMEVGERLVNVWCDNHGIRTEHRSDFSGRVRADISGTHIRRILTLDRPEFLTLTAYNTWRTPLK